MRRIVFTVTIYAITCLAQAASAGTARPSILVVHPPLYPLVEAITKGTGAPKLLLSSTQDSHHLQLRPKQAAAIAAADIIIVADRGLSTALLKPIQARVDKGALLIAITELEGVDPLPYRAYNGFTKTDEAHEGYIDPHIWLDPVRMARAVTALAAIMGTWDMANEATYQMNALALAAHLREEVDSGIRMLLASRSATSKKSAISYITYHDAYQYFEQRYGLSPTGYITQRPEEYIGAKAMKTLMESARDTRVRCLISETQSPLTKRFALYTEARIELLSPERLYAAKDAPSASWVRNDYDRLLIKVAHTFGECIGGKKQSAEQ